MMSQETGVFGKYSNQSWRGYQAVIPEKLIQELTGHRSLDGLHRYEQTSEAQLVNISNVVANNKTSEKSIPSKFFHNSK